MTPDEVRARFWTVVQRGEHRVTDELEDVEAARTVARFNRRAAEP